MDERHSLHCARTVLLRFDVVCSYVSQTFYLLTPTLFVQAFVDCQYLRRSFGA